VFTDLMTALTETLAGTAGLAILGAFVWGLASVLLSPCHLASVPLVVAYTGRTTHLSGWRAAGLATAFALGILVTVAALGALSLVAGHLLRSLGGIANYLVAALLFAVGLDLLGVWPVRWPGMPRAETTRRGVTGAFLFGLTFGLALGPCTLAFLAPVLGVAARVASSRPLLGVALVAAYALGHCGVLAAAGGAGPLLVRWLGWTERRSIALRRACGVLVVASGLYLVYVAR
jgi:cytochrome c-type biogenesis protein